MGTVVMGTEPGGMGLRGEVLGAESKMSEVETEGV